MRFGLRAILLLAAIFLFLLALILDDNTIDLLLLGLALFAASHLVEELGMDTGHRTTTTTRGPGA